MYGFQQRGGDEMLPAGQGEADEILELMTRYSVSSLLPRGTNTWKGEDHESTVDLVLVSEGLTDGLIKCGTHGTEHGPDHRTLETVFEMDMEIPKRWWTSSHPTWHNNQGASIYYIYYHFPPSPTLLIVFYKSACPTFSLCTYKKNTHDAKRQLNKSHWDAFLADNDDIIGKAAKY